MPRFKRAILTAIILNLLFHKKNGYDPAQIYYCVVTARELTIMTPAFHALVLNLHQPAGNLEYLLAHQPWEAKEILYALDRIPRSLWPPYEALARVHLSLSGTLLETLSNSNFQKQVYGVIKCGDLLWHLQNTRIFEILGTGYYHPVLPLTPTADWEAHLQQGLYIAQHLFSRERLAGFWPPEMSFCMEMIPYLKRMGYRYVLVDSEYVVPLQPMRWEEIRYRPHVARYGDDEIIVVVRDRDLSNAQEAGMAPAWFDREVRERTKWCQFPPLVTTCTDGENGGWFRNITVGSNFWEGFYQPFLDQVRLGQSGVAPIFISDYLDHYGTHGAVAVRTGAWNTGKHTGVGFVQWTGSQAQKDAWRRVRETSGAFHQLHHKIADSQDASLQQQLAEAHWHLLRAETSCHFYWGDAWLQRCHDELDQVWYCLNRVEAVLT